MAESSRGVSPAPKGLDATNSAALPPTGPKKRGRKKRGAQPQDGDKGKESERFSASIQKLMFSFGDDKEPLKESVELMEDIVKEYVADLTQKMVDAAGSSKKIDAGHLLYVLRRDREKYFVAKDARKTFESIKRSRKAASMF